MAVVNKHGGSSPPSPNLACCDQFNPGLNSHSIFYIERKKGWLEL
jgi:hypothetical protein